MSKKGLTLLVVSVVVAAGAVGVAFGVRGTDPAPAEKALAATGEAPRNSELRWEGGGVAFSPPPNWNPGATNDDNTRLLVAPGGESSLLVRSLPLPFQVTEDTLPSMKEYAARIVSSGDGVTLSGEAEDVEVAGMRGFLYRYGFRDSGTGQRGVHDHYFFFPGGAMVTAVFQALPEGEYAGLAPIRDGVLQSVRLLEPATPSSQPEAPKG
jgi:hypothetical protein